MWWYMYICARVPSVEDSGGAGVCLCELAWVLCLCMGVCMRQANN